MSIRKVFAVAAAAMLPSLVGHAQTLTTLYSFTGEADGGTPTGLVYQNNELIGTTSQGGTFNQSCAINSKNGCGTVFQVDPVNGGETVVLSFAGGTRGDAPDGPPILRAGKVLGTTALGGHQNGGIIFRVDPATGAESVLAKFAADGPIYPQGVIYQGGALYGVSQYGGTFHDGQIFKLDLATRTVTTLYNFAGGSDGQSPLAPLIYENGILYGTTFSGGNACGGNPAGCGTVFSFNPASGTETVLHSFAAGTDGANPENRLLYRDGILYGTTASGGTGCGNGCGIVFSVDPSTGAEAVVHNFTGKDGEEPYSGLIYHGGALYGTTIGGGAKDHGTVFKVKLATGAEKVVYSFTGQADAENPSGLIYRNGIFYGITLYGAGTGCGGVGCGTVFKLIP